MASRRTAKYGQFMRMLTSLLKRYKRSMTATVILAFVGAALPAHGQDLVPVSNISGGSGVFVFRKSSAPRRFTSSVKASRSREQRNASAKRVRKQYETHSAETAKTTRSAVVSPDKAATAVRTMK